MPASLESGQPRAVRRQAIRPLAPADLAAVAGICERVMRSGRSEPSAGLVDCFRRFFLAAPGHDPEIPSLVYEDSTGRLTGFLGVQVRRIRFDGHPLRMACSGPHMMLPEARGPAGVFLLRQFLQGPQDLSITDGATDEARRLWEHLGGQTALAPSLGWTRPLRPLGFAGEWLAKRRPALDHTVRFGRPLLRLADAAFRGLLHHRLRAQPVPAGLREEVLDAEAMAAAWPALSSGRRLRPDYDAPHLAWLLEEMAKVRSRGALMGHLVRTGEGAPRGWYLYYLSRRRIAHVVQLVAAERHAEQVLACLLADADRHGAVAVQGRLDSGLADPICRAGGWIHYRAPTLSLAHSRHLDVSHALHTGQACLTRADGEWWTGFSFERFDGRPAVASA